MANTVPRFIFTLTGVFLLFLSSLTYEVRRVEAFHVPTQRKAMNTWKTSPPFSKDPLEKSKINTKAQSIFPTRGGSIGTSMVKDPKSFSPDYPVDIPRISITIACTVLTWFAQRQYSNVMASSAMTLICSMCFDKRLGQAAFCGSFAGMGSIGLVPSWKYALGLGTLTSIFFEYLIHNKNYYLGVGGRLGATAFIASSIIALLQRIPTGLSLSSLPTFSALGAIMKTNTVWSMAVWHAVGSIATIVLREAGDNSRAADPVRASAVIGLIAALLVEDKSIALALYGGSFIGMSLPSRLIHGIIPGKGKADKPINVFGLLASFGIAGALGGVVHGVTIGLDWWSGGWGGKAGFCAFIGCLLFRGMSKMKESVLNLS